jgi:hypothetical protein
MSKINYSCFCSTRFIARTRFSLFVPKSAQNREPYHSNSFGGIVGLRLFRIGRDLDILSRIRDVSHSTGTYILALLYKCRLAS